ncbi:nSTAND1 domain-containing NTPase [Sorangium sp. So ce131]|uniref:serine/threonine-protein kinase n=1 Tax=Sorangium sp. So ce131 TaxID=3133282 RepID=UPI003F61D2B9
MALPGDSIGPYQILRTIGSGGIGHVFAAVHRHMGQEVALKVLSPESAGDPRMVARFIQESRALAQLQHPGIVRVRHFDKLEDGTAYLAMEHLEGITLRAWIQQQDGPVPLEAALAIGRQIADAMAEVHAKGIVHRDLKPENVLLVQDAAAPLGLQPKVVDFGIAKVPPPVNDTRGDTHVQTAAHDVLGTSAYMAPEQWKRASEVTDRADVYALGVVLFELVAGKPPFDATDDVALLVDHVNTPPPHLHERVASVPASLGAFVSSMLAKAPEQRPTMLRCRDMLARPWEAGKDECPFPGLQPFSEAQAELFFGRDAEIREIVDLLEEMREEGTRRWLQIEGPSGAGKSSLVQAGVLPRLTGRSPGGAPWIVATLRPSEDPIKSLATAIAAVCSAHGAATPPAEIEAALRADGAALGALVSRCVPAGARLLLVVEQFEELFALGGAHLHQVDALLSACLTGETAPLRLLTTLRSDYFHRLEQTPGLARLLNNKASRYHLRPMAEEALEQVILGMADRAGLQLSEGLPERMVRDAAGTDDRLPLLGHTLRSLWSSRAAAALTHEHYERIGGVGGALAHHAAQLLDGLGEDGRERAKWLLLDLVQVGRGTPDTRRPRTRKEVLAAAGGDRLAEQVLMRLSGIPVGQAAEAPETLRLVVMARDPPADPSQQRVDLVHETLLQRVPAVVGWIDAERALLERHADLEVAAHAWEQSGSQDDGLPSGALLDHYRGKIGAVHQRERLLRMASERARAFVGKAEARERRHIWARRALGIALGAVVMVIAVTSLWAWRERERAEDNRKSILRTTGALSSLDWKLGRLLHTANIRSEILTNLDVNLSSLSEQEQNELDVVEEVVRTMQRRSDFARSNGRLSESHAFLSMAERRIWFGLTIEPAHEILRLRLALNHSKRGKLELASGLPERARVEFERSVAELVKLHDIDANNYRRTLATSYAEQADVELELGHAPAAAALYDKAIGLLQQLDEPGEEDRRYNLALLAQTAGLLGEALRRNGDLRAAASRIEQARQTQEGLVRAEPGNAFLLLTLGKLDATLAAVRVDEEQTAEASRLYEQAASTGEALILGDPHHKEYGLLLCQSLRGVEELANGRGDRERAAEAHERRCDTANRFLARDPEDVRFKRLACP